MSHLHPEFPVHPQLPVIPTVPEPDARLEVAEDGCVAARASLWLRGPDLEGRRSGLIGHYAAATHTAGVRVLEEACARLRAAGAHLALGPLDGSTWFGYRLVTEPGHEAPFFLEPHHPPRHLEDFAAAGFGPVLHYFSALCTAYRPDPRRAELAARFAPVCLRCASAGSAEADLAAIYRLSLEAFAANPLYSPLPRPAFEALYRPLLERVPLEWVWLAECEGEVLGFVFALPDLLRPQGDSLIVKTVAVRPGRAQAGLGRYLVDELHRRAFAAGFTRVIHALMWDGNDSSSISRRYATPMRRYALFARKL
ncbi:L-amino acid N-acyltransferase YncA [Deinobacterium chartae]|uniref:L-amino acid N-acyltransferase YncA n=1 Tax=Deinobacterium chartae TaxID=521158 RepID=A0A841I1F1_9DEIO|nr:GNAT family N-acetyltransferase [Deinobacterium chartae]MBB6099517.1 L-amino acid N-acyltransferase YncA [Deinobacterium chartae]